MSTKQNKITIANIRSVHREIDAMIDDRLAEFKRIWEEGDDRKLFIELVFCILTPQSGARRSWKAVESLVGKNLLFAGGFDDICPELNIVRFKNNKTSYILEARDRFIGKGVSIRKILEGLDGRLKQREWIAKNVKGLGFKEASHYLRNIGLGDSLAILDRHILRSMVTLGLIKTLPASISPRLYLELEERLGDFSKKAGISLAHLDFVLWYMAAGDIFK